MAGRAFSGSQLDQEQRVVVATTVGIVGRSRRQQRSKARYTKSDSLNERSSSSRRKTNKMFFFSSFESYEREGKKNSPWIFLLPLLPFPLLVQLSL